MFLKQAFKSNPYSFFAVRVLPSGATPNNYLAKDKVICYTFVFILLSIKVRSQQKKLTSDIRDAQSFSVSLSVLLRSSNCQQVVPLHEK